MLVSVASKLFLAHLALVSIVLQLSTCASLNESATSKSALNYWQERKDWFYKRTSFDLTEDNHRLLGSERLMYENKSARQKGHLPFWFDYELYKKMFNKRTASDEQLERARHNTYINTCMRVLKARVLYRMLAGTSDTFLTSDADKFYWEIFGPVQDDSQEQENNEISFSIVSRIDTTASEQEDPLDRAIRLVKQEMDIVESRNQVVTNLRAFNELDGSAIRGKLPYK